MADNIILEAKIELFQNCLVQLIDKMQEVRMSDSKSEWIKCTAKLIEQRGEYKQGYSYKVAWDPGLEGLKSIFKDLINLTISKIGE